MELDAVVQEKLEADTDFNKSLETLSDTDKGQAIEKKKSEIIKQVFAELGSKAEKDAQIAEDQKKRAEKAELDAKRAKDSKVESKEGLSTDDVLYLAKAPIHEEDVSEVIEWAKFKKIGVKEAHGQLKGTFDVRDEQRRTAALTQTKGGTRGGSKTNGEELLSKAEKTGEVPETAEEMKALAEARIARLKASRK